jgi:hypothetical protein
LTSKIRRTLIQAATVAAVLLTVSTAVQLYVTKWRPAADQWRLTQIFKGSNEPLHLPLTHSQTAWEVMKSDKNISSFVRMIEDFPDIVLGLTSVAGKFTVLAPTNAAFEREPLAHDTPDFGYMMLVGYHMGPGSFSDQALLETNTISSFLNADRFFKYKQRLSIQPCVDGISVNFRAKLIGPGTVSIIILIKRVKTADIFSR